MVATDGSAIIAEVTNASFSELGLWNSVVDYPAMLLQGLASDATVDSAGYHLQPHIIGRDIAEPDTALAKESVRFNNYVSNVAASSPTRGYTRGTNNGTNNKTGGSHPHSKSSSRSGSGRTSGDTYMDKSTGSILSLSGVGQSFYTRLAHSHTRPGLICGYANTLMVMGADGCARLFDVDASLGLGYQAGRALRTLMMDGLLDYV